MPLLIPQSLTGFNSANTPGTGELTNNRSESNLPDVLYKGGVGEAEVTVME